MAFSFRDKIELRKLIRSMGGHGGYLVNFPQNFAGMGSVTIGGRKHGFKAIRNGDGWELDEPSLMAIKAAFAEEPARLAREKQDFALCKAMLDPEDETRIWEEKGKFKIETTNTIYQNAKNATELLQMIGNVKTR